jgi:hypothetical protein
MEKLSSNSVYERSNVLFPSRPFTPPTLPVYFLGATFANELEEVLRVLKPSVKLLSVHLAQGRCDVLSRVTEDQQAVRVRIFV